MTASQAGQTDAGSVAAPTPRRDWTVSTVWTLTLLGIISAFNFVDRSIFGLNLQLIKEEMEISDTIAVINHGAIEQVGAPRELYDTPATEFVMRFVGDANLVALCRRNALGLILH